jgi:hypothetical protein
MMTASSHKRNNHHDGTTEETSSKESIAFENAYRTFTQRYPQWKAALFDEHFLRSRVVNRQAQQIDSQGLADEWAQQFQANQASRNRNIHDLLPAARDFLKLYTHSLCDY